MKVARDLIRRPEVWRAIEALAKELIEKETLPGRAAEAIAMAELRREVKGGRSPMIRRRYGSQASPGGV